MKEKLQGYFMCFVLGSYISTTITAVVLWIARAKYNYVFIPEDAYLFSFIGLAVFVLGVSTGTGVENKVLSAIGIGMVFEVLSGLMFNILDLMYLDLETKTLMSVILLFSVIILRRSLHKEGYRWRDVLRKKT